MNLDQQVCSLEIAKRLKELGLKQDSYFYWWDGDDVNDEGHCVTGIELIDHSNAPSNFKDKTINKLFYWFYQ